jgi:uncharacterized membrane protein YkvA (DUF1232 family)
VNLTLRVEKMFTRKQRVPIKHITTLADPCDTPPALPMKHLFTALFRIIQTDLENRDEQDHTRETIRKVEKAASGADVIRESVVEWLTFMDPKVMARVEGEVDDLVLASMLIDWAVSSKSCREEMDANIESLRVLKTENTQSVKTLRSGTPPRKTPKSNR